MDDVSFLFKLLYCITSTQDNTETAGGSKTFLNWMLVENTDRTKKINVGLQLLAQNGETLLMSSQTKQ